VQKALIAEGKLKVKKWYEAETPLTRCSWLFIGRHCLRDALVVIILHLEDLDAFGLVILRAITNKQALTTADNKRCRCTATINVLPIVTSRAPKDASQEFEDPIDSILLTLVPLAGNQRLLPEMLVGGLELVKISRYSLLVALDSRDATGEGVDVQKLGTALTWYRPIAIGKIGVLLATTLVFSSHKTEKIGLSSVKIRVVKVPKLCFGVAFQDALLKVRYLMKSVHVQLTNERREVAMLEKSRKDIIRKALVLKDYGYQFRARERGGLEQTIKRVSNIGPSYEFVGTLRIYQPRRARR
jgi:hypothetical protein